MKLYEIDQAIQACLDMDMDEVVDMETGEILRLDELQMEREKKLEGVACYIKNTLADAEALKAEKDALAKREQTARKKAERLKAWLQDALQGEKLNTSKVAISYRKSEALEITNEDQVVLWCMGNLHNDLLIHRAPDANKVALKKFLKESGETVPGAELVERQNLQIR